MKRKKLKVDGNNIEKFVAERFNGLFFGQKGPLVCRTANQEHTDSFGEKIGRGELFITRSLDSLGPYDYKLSVRSMMTIVGLICDRNDFVNSLFDAHQKTLDEMKKAAAKAVKDVHDQYLMDFLEREDTT